MGTPSGSHRVVGSTAAQGSASGPDRMYGSADPARLPRAASYLPFGRRCSPHYGTLRIPVQTQYARSLTYDRWHRGRTGHYLALSDRLVGRRPVAGDRRLVARARCARPAAASARSRRRRARASTPPTLPLPLGRHTERIVVIGRGRRCSWSSRRGRGAAVRPTSQWQPLALVGLLARARARQRLHRRSTPSASGSAARSSASCWRWRCSARRRRPRIGLASRAGATRSAPARPRHVPAQQPRSPTPRSRCSAGSCCMWLDRAWIRTRAATRVAVFAVFIGDEPPELRHDRRAHRAAARRLADARCSARLPPGAAVGARHRRR